MSDVFVGTTLTALDDLQQMHTYLLIATIIVMVAVVLIVLIPFRKRLLGESVKLAGLLSQLPQVRGTPEGGRSYDVATQLLCVFLFGEVV